jgi:hypothetical protein
MDRAKRRCLSAEQNGPSRYPASHREVTRMVYTCEGRVGSDALGRERTMSRLNRGKVFVVLELFDGCGC